MNVELLQFRFSPYNEKVRWALDLKRVPHRRRSLLPGPHMPVVRRLTGQTQTPVLRLDGAPVHGSACIIESLERSYPEPALYPAASSERAEALALQAYFDDQVGPRTRCNVLAAGEAAMQVALDRVAQGAAATGYLVGGRFSLADLAAAAILAPSLALPGTPMARPEPMPEALAAWTGSWADHPGARWVARIYASHRPPVTDRDGAFAYG